MSITTTAPMMGAQDWIRLLVSSGGSARRWPDTDARVHWFSRGAWAMQAAARGLEIARGRLPAIWLPDYFCNQPLYPLRKMGARLVFYPVDASLAPHWAACNRIAEAASPDLFVLVHYFGHPADAKAARRFADRTGAWLMEDAAHCAAPSAGIGEEGDVCFFSLYKHLPVPDGAVLLIRRGANGPMEEAIAQYRQDAAGAPSSAGWLAKRALQSILPAAGTVRGTPETLDADPPPADLPETPQLSRIAWRLLDGAAERLPKIAARRRQNNQVLRDLFSGIDGLTPLFSPPDGGDAPYRTVFRASDPETASRWYDRIRRSGNAVESWPDLPPEVRAAPDAHETALDLRRTVLCLPIHVDRSPAALRAAYRVAL